MSISKLVNQIEKNDQSKKLEVRNALDKEDAKKGDNSSSTDNTHHEKSSGTPPKKPLKFGITGLTVKQGRLTLNDALILPSQTISRTFTDVEISAGHDLGDQKLTFDISLRDESEKGIGTIAAIGKLAGLTERFRLEKPLLTVKATVNDHHIAAIKPYLKNDLLSERLDGSVSFEVDYQGSLDKNGQTSGVIDLSHLTYTDQSLWETPLPAMDTKLNFDTSFSPDELVIKTFNLATGKMTLDGKSRLENWSEVPVFKEIALSGEISLVDLSLLLPWKRLGSRASLWKEVLAGGGSVKIENASLTELDLSTLPDERSSLWEQIQLTGVVSGLSVQPSNSLPKVPLADNINAAIRIKDGIMEVEGITADIAAVSLPDVSLRISQFYRRPQFETKFVGPITIADGTDDSLNNFLKSFGLDRLTMKGDLDLVVQFDSTQPDQFSINGTLDLQDGLIKTSYSPAFLQSLRTDVTLTTDTASVSNLSTNVMLPNKKGSTVKTVSLSLQGNLTDWQNQPILNLENLKTSPISLHALADVIPWKQFKNSSTRIQKIFKRGGTIEIAQLSLPSINLSAPLKNIDQVLPTVKASLNLNGITVKPSPYLPPFEKVTGKPSLEKGVLTTADLTAQIGPLTTPNMNIRVTDLMKNPKINVAAKGKMSVIGTEDETVEMILQEHGFKTLSGNANVDFVIAYDHAHPDKWSINGSAILEKIEAVSHPENVKISDLKGRVSYSKKDQRELVLEDVTANIDDAPIRLAGKITGKNMATLSVDLEAKANQLDLGEISTFIPAMEKLGLSGQIDMDMAIYLPHNEPLQSRLTGMLRTHQVEWKPKNPVITAKDVNSEIEFTGRSANIKILKLALNEQVLDVTGTLSHPEAPALDLTITSPDLNFDHFWPVQKSAEKSDESQNDQPANNTPTAMIKEEKVKIEKPRFMRISKANIRLEAPSGRFRKQELENLRISVEYDEGLIKNYTLDFSSGGGHASAKGSIDFRNQGYVEFNTYHDTKVMPLKTVVALMAYDEEHIGKQSVFGPASVAGRTSWRSGTKREVFNSLTGNLTAEMGEGHLKSVGPMGKSVVKMLTFFSLSNLLKGNLTNKMEGDGVAFDSIIVEAQFEGGKERIKYYDFKSDAFNLSGQGTVSIADNWIDLESRMEVFNTVGKAISVVPVLGKAAKNISSLYFIIDGSLDNPNVKLSPFKGFAKSAKDTLSAPKRAVNDTKEFRGR